MRAATILLGLMTAFAPLATADDTLSVIPLAKALQNSALHGDNPGPARQAVADMLLNQPLTDAETNRFHTRLADLARSKDTRVGQLFFRALETMPDVKQVQPAARKAEIQARRPLALDASIRVHVEWRRAGDDAEWKVSRLDVVLEGAAAGPVMKAAPYFADGPAMSQFFDAEELDFLVGRDPADRRRVDPEPFDFHAALETYLRCDDDGYAALISRLREQVKPTIPREERSAALKPHLTRDAQRALEAADADPARREKLWQAVIESLEAAHQGAQPSGVPTARGAQVQARTTDAGGNVLSECVVQRLQSGEISPRIRIPEETDGAAGK